MPIPPSLIATPSDQDEQQDPIAPDPVNVPEDPAHPMWLEEQLWTPSVRDSVVQIATFLAGERDLGYMETNPRWADEPAEDVRDWGVWAFHGIRTYDFWED